MTKLERAYVHEMRTMLALGIRPSSRAVMCRVIDAGKSKRDKRSVLRYGPGAPFSRLHRVVLAEWEDYMKNGLSEVVLT